MNHDTVTIQVQSRAQAVFYFDGSGASYQLTDTMTKEVMSEVKPVTRAVMVARLRAMADMIESGGEER